MSLPLPKGAIYVHCPECNLIGWADNDPTRAMPLCPGCEVATVEGLPEAGGAPLLYDAGPDVAPYTPYRVDS